jgi:hemolysin III
MQGGIFMMGIEKVANAPISMVLTSGNHYQTQTFQVKDPISAMTHFIGFIGAIVGMPVLLIQAAKYGASQEHMISFAVFMLSMILLYGASTAYHSFDISKRANKILKKIDHMMIFVLIAGSYTPICTMVLGEKRGSFLLILVWAIALMGMILKACWVTCPKWFSSVIYISMGWVCLLAFDQIYANLPLAGFLWLLAGGIMYTLGGVIYALKLSILSRHFKNFGPHELFHIFVMAGSFCHFMVMYGYVVTLS